MATYLNLKIGAARRLAYLRGYVQAHNEKVAKKGYGLTLDSWKAARTQRLDSTGGGLSAGYNEEYGRKFECHTTFDIAALPGRCDFADEIHSSFDTDSVIRNNGWYADADCNSVMRGIVVYLTHGRFLAGYTWSENGEHVIFHTVYDDWREAARAADEHARICAEGYKEYDERYQEAKKLESDIEHEESLTEARLTRIRECIKVRHVSEYWRDELRGAIEDVRELRESVADKKQKLKDDYADCDI